MTRDEVINGLRAEIERAQQRGDIYLDMVDTRVLVAAMKEIERSVPVVHGRWVKMTGMMPPEYHGHYECSECQWHMKGLRNSWTREEELSYCPNCGARMDRG